MANPFLGTIMPFGTSFAPRGWATCEGQLLAISSNSALFSLLGTTYGGDGTTTFALPDLRGRAMIHPGRGPGLTPRSWGQLFGTETTTMLSTNIPSHQHGVSVQVSTAAADSDEANGNFLATAGANIYANAPAAGEHYGTPSNTSNTGAQLPFNNMQPWLGLIICIAMQGVYPSRN